MSGMPILRRGRVARTPSAAASLVGLAMVAVLLLASSVPSQSWVPPATSRRAAAAAAGAALLANSGVLAASAASKPQQIAPGYVPAEYLAKKVGETVTTPNGVVYTPLDLGVTTDGLRDGPPRSQSNVWVKYTARVNSPDGPVFDSSELRGSRKAGKPDYAEVRLNLDPTLPNGVYEALKLMKVGGKGRAVVPPSGGYADGKVAFEGDELGEVKGLIPAESTLYYDLELVNIVKP
mmetsp:Transcript_54013/g.155098  ORF Transcript_54013/g.155098 Transcript_54013/m.155098 type:complete len:235 (+) Transcript_54013:65-769(+)